MKKNYSSNINSRSSKKTPAIFKMMLLAAMIFTYAGFNNNLFAQVPAAPVATAASNFTCTSVNANWGAVSGAVTYFLDVSTDPLFGSFLGVYNNVNTGSVTTYNVTGLTANTTYYYRVRDNNGSNTSLNSNTITFNTSAPAASTATAASNITCTSMNANWGAVAGALSYYIDVATDAGFSTFVTGYNNLNVGNVLTYNITGLTANTTYYYRIRAGNGCSISLNSTTIIASTSSPSAPAATACSNLTCTSLNANWASVPGASAYFLDVSTSASFGTYVSGYSNVNAGNVTTYNVTGLTPNITYYYRIRASNGCSTSLNSNTISVLTCGTAQAAPAATAASGINCTSFNSNWTAAANATTYFLDVCTDVLFNNFVSGYNNLNVGNVTTFNVTGLIANTTYYYRLRASDGSTTSLNSNSITVTTSSACVQTAPVATSASNITCTSLNANWAAVGGSITYFLDVSTDPLFGSFVGTYNNLNVGNVTTYNVTGLIVNNTYYYRLRANDGSTTSINSNTISIDTSAPAAPVATAVSNFTCTSINANWGAAVGATAYFLDLSTNSSFSTFVGMYNNTNTGNVTTYNITGLTVNTTYYYRVRGMNGCSTSLNSNTITFSTSSSTSPTSATASPNTISAGDPAVLTENGGTLGVGGAYNWYSGSCGGTLVGSGSSISVTPSLTTTYFVRAQDACSTSSCASVTVIVNPAVWPGDANNDSIVNNTDLLPIGLFYSQTGTPRTSSSNSWQAFSSAPWGTAQTNGQDIKHVDCNGDGLIDSNDTLAINLNFNLTHAIVPFQNNNSGIRTSDMYFVISGSSFTAGSMIDAELWLGSSGAPISGLYGVSFNINFDASLIQTGTGSISYPPSWIGTQGTNAIKISKIDELANTAYGAITRIDHTNANGFGKIADFKFQIKNSLTGPAMLHLSGCCVKADNAAGVSQVFTTRNDSISINQTSGILEKNDVSVFNIFPNPFTSQTTISFTKEIKNGTAKIIDVVGREVRSINFSGSRLVVEKGELNAGVYFLEIASEKNVIANKKIIIQ